MFIFVFADKDLQVYSTLYILKHVVAEAQTVGCLPRRFTVQCWSRL